VTDVTTPTPIFERHRHDDTHDAGADPIFSLLACLDRPLDPFQESVVAIASHPRLSSDAKLLMVAQRLLETVAPDPEQLAELGLPEFGRFLNLAPDAVLAAVVDCVEASGDDDAEDLEAGA
jgi:hypothetical protein